ncbi:hypothetical protein TEA_024512 [Camellia sinensis var. sinensis]|uniref:Peptidase M16 C-terminal domain-containing protein n=1 Tax=Camellia sinensis var. sinensis TaxID=542762 RepID=A0A4S4D0X6_CAMSN|nr:hypothetical protein TEA_024512 [Camellia sinensis var. sinensis]
MLCPVILKGISYRLIPVLLPKVTVVGYNHKLRILLETVVEKIAKFEVKPERFAVIKEMVTKDYQNFKFQQPYQQAMYYCSLILEDQTWPWIDGLEVLPHLEVDNLSKFVPLMLSRTFLECYITGNVEPNEAELMIHHIEDIFFNGPQPICQALFPSQHLTNRVIKLERGVSYFYPAEGLNPSDENSSLVHYIQVHQDDFKMNVTLQLFALIAKQPAFHQLRSVEQLGYITVLMQRNDSGIRGLQFIIQSTIKDPRQIDLRVEAFLEMFASKLYEMSGDEFKSNVNALIDMKLEKHKNLREESSFYWREISDGTLKFDRRECEVAALKQLTQKELIDFFNEYIKVGAPRKKSLSTQVYGGLHSSEYKTDQSEPTKPNMVRIDDIFSFRRSRPLFSSFKGGFGHMRLPLFMGSSLNHSTEAVLQCSPSPFGFSLLLCFTAASVSLLCFVFATAFAMLLPLFSLQSSEIDSVIGLIFCVAASNSL